MNSKMCECGCVVEERSSDTGEWWNYCNDCYEKDQEEEESDEELESEEEGWGEDEEAASSARYAAMAEGASAGIEGAELTAMVEAAVAAAQREYDAVKAASAERRREETVREWARGWVAAATMGARGEEEAAAQRVAAAQRNYEAAKAEREALAAQRAAMVAQRKAERDNC
jgi:hypothetical protein